ncbi:MAG: tRNA (guanosine(46)-N7)-methyltransferase TrmB [Muribaculaceae bacterium]|nr:tRNA (guanosine(46)-N7)-methyltransferase TrmB [Muribaculaceae bacterium]
MGKNKLRKFAEMKEMANVVETPRDVLLSGGFSLKGHWRSEFFPQDLPIVLELGCGKGEYTVGLARRDACRNHIGVDIKGARMYTGAREALDTGLSNAAFLRTEIELIDQFFAPGEVEEIWITFPDPQMKKVNKRLTSTRFLRSYRKFLSPDGVVNLKTDSPFLFEYTRRLAQLNGLEIIDLSTDLHGEGRTGNTTDIRTFYESQWLARGKKIKFISFRIGAGDLTEPDTSDLEKDDYRAVPRFNPNEEFLPNSKYDNSIS